MIIDGYFKGVLSRKKDMKFCNLSKYEKLKDDVAHF